MNSTSSRLADAEYRLGHWRLTPARIAGLYLLFALGLLYVSDVVLPAAVESSALLADLQFAAELLELGLTAALIYGLTAHSWRVLQVTTEDLTAARRGLSVLHRLFRHNLRNELTLVAGHAQELGQQLDSEPLTDHCDAIRDRCDDLISSTEKAKLAAELDPETVELRTVDLSATLARVGEQVRTECPAVDLEVSLPEDARVHAHEYVEFAILEMVENAVRHHDGAAPAVTISVRESPEYADWLELTVADDGPGIPPGELDALLEGENPLEHGSGVGLWMASWIVYRSGGDFELENTAEGCRVTFSLPRAESVRKDRALDGLRRLLA